GRRRVAAVADVDHQAARDLVLVDLAAPIGVLVAVAVLEPRRLAAVVAHAARAGARVGAADLARLARLAAGVAVVAAAVRVGGLGLRARDAAAVAVLRADLTRRMAARRVLADVVPVLAAGRPAR